MKGPPKPNKENPGTPIGPDFNGEIIFKIMVVVGIVIAMITPIALDHQNRVETQEFRQNIADLQNRVYELENDSR